MHETGQVVGIVGLHRSATAHSITMIVVIGSTIGQLKLFLLLLMMMSGVVVIIGLFLIVLMIG